MMTEQHHHFATAKAEAPIRAGRMTGPVETAQGEITREAFWVLDHVPGLTMQMEM